MVNSPTTNETKSGSEYSLEFTDVIFMNIHEHNIQQHSWKCVKKIINVPYGCSWTMMNAGFMNDHEHIYIYMLLLNFDDFLFVGHQKRAMIIH